VVVLLFYLLLVLEADILRIALKVHYF